MSSTTSDALKQKDWTKPAAVAIPKGGYLKDKVEQGRYGPIFPKTPACYGFSIIAKIIPGREPGFYEYAQNIEKAVAAQPDVLAVLKLHYLRWNLFTIKGETYFQYMGIFDTDFDKYTEDPQGLEDECSSVHQVRSRPSLPKLSGIRRVSLRERRRDQEGAEAQGCFLKHA